MCLGLNSYLRHPYDVALGVPAGGCVDKEVLRLLVIGLKVEVVAGFLDSQEGVFHDFLHLLLEFGNNIDQNKGLVEAFLL